MPNSEQYKHIEEVRKNDPIVDGYISRLEKEIEEWTNERKGRRDT